ncbi:MAG TPA: endonuclease domain-containing protein, partial [Saprospiraceae bacterium]|nr:endonuclease domain-containing protein [Saprospiraceae bacterium]
ELRNNQFGVRFKCQHPISKYVVDFYCHPLRFVIEVDGSIHLLQEIHDNDEWREANLRNFGLKVIRFSNEMVIYDIENVKNQIINTMIERIHVAPTFHDLGYNDNDKYSMNSFDQPPG